VAVFSYSASISRDWLTLHGVSSIPAAHNPELVEPIRHHGCADSRFHEKTSRQIRRGKAYKSHILTHKSAKRKRRLAQTGLVPRVEQKRMKQLLPYR